MLHCFQCGADLPDNLVYCLQCGARLEIDDDPTIVDPPIVIPIDPTPSPVDPSPFPIDPRPIPSVPKQGSGILKFVLGGAIGAGVVVVILVLLGIVIYTLQGDQSTGNTRSNAMTTNTPTPTPSPTPTATKKQTPTPDPANGNTETAAVTKVCDVVNPAGGTVNLRRYCDTRDCSQDSSTLYIQAEQGDVVERTSRRPVTSGRFTWVQVKYGGELLWISSNRINCD